MRCCLLPAPSVQLRPAASVGIELVRRVYLEGAELHEVAFNFVQLLGVAAVTLPLAAWLFRNRLA